MATNGLPVPAPPAFAPEIAPEFAFVCAALGAAAGGAQARADGPLDPARLAAVARRHQVVPLVVEALRRSGQTVPPALADAYDPVAPLRLAREAVRLNRMLAAAGVEALFLKGSTLAVLAYGSVGMRQFGDIDLLVAPENAATALRVLRDAGYELPAADASADRLARLAAVAKDLVLHHQLDGHVVELHWRMTDNPRERHPPAKDTQAVPLAPGATVRTLEDAALFTYCCQHGAAHLWARLRWLADVAALLGRAPDGGDRLWQGAVARGQGRAAASAILLARDLFGTVPPPAFRAPRSGRLRLLVWAARRVIAAGGGEAELARSAWRGWAELGGKLLVASSPGDLAGWGARLLYAPADDERMESWLWFVLHPLRRVPRLLQRRRLRRRARGNQVQAGVRR